MKRNILKELYPTTKLFLALVLFISAFIIPGWPYSYFLAVVCGIVAFLYGKAELYIKRIFFPLKLIRAKA